VGPQQIDLDVGTREKLHLPCQESSHVPPANRLITLLIYDRSIELYDISKIYVKYVICKNVPLGSVHRLNYNIKNYVLEAGFCYLLLAEKGEEDRKSVCWVSWLS
jgi:hypothetical protein